MFYFTNHAHGAMTLGFIAEALAWKSAGNGARMEKGFCLPYTQATLGRDGGSGRYTGFSFLELSWIVGYGATGRKERNAFLRGGSLA